MLIKSKFAQGSTEFLIILSVIGVCALLIIALFFGVFDSASNDPQLEKVKYTMNSPSQTIQLSDGTVDSTGNAIFVVANTTDYTLHLVGYSVDSNEFDLGDGVTLKPKESRSIFLPNIGNCSTNNSCTYGNIIFHYSAEDSAIVLDSVIDSVSINKSDSVTSEFVGEDGLVCIDVGETLACHSQEVVSAKQIISFDFDSLEVTGVVNESEKTISLTTPIGTNVTALIPTITNSSFTQVNPASGVAQNFSSPVNYTVTALDGTSQVYVVTVTVLLSSEKAITAFDFDSLEVVGEINEGEKTISLTVPSETSLTSLTPTIAISSFATISPLSGLAQDFTSPVTYTVTAEDSSTQEYVVTVTNPFEDGSIVYPWIINNCLQLQDMNLDLDANFMLGRNIDCGADTNNPSGALWNNGAGFRPIGNSTTVKFTGNFLGNNKWIRNLYIYLPTTDYVGLFGYVNSAGSDINDLGMVDSNITGRTNVGGITGYFGIINNSYNTGTITGLGENVGGINGSRSTLITNSYNNGKINGNLYVGGISGYFSTINNSYNTGEITGATSVGGITGWNSTVNNSYNTGLVIGASSTGGISGKTGIINNSYNLGEVRGTNYTGGISGGSATINYCYNTGTVSGSELVGGITGYGLSTKIISFSYNTGTVTGTNKVGGITGTSGKIESSYNTGTITGTTRVGGLSGDAAEIKNSYNTGTVNASGEYSGGIIGYEGEVHNSYNIATVNGQSKTGGISGNGSKVSNSYNIGRVNGTSYVAGIMGYQTGYTIVNSFSTGSIGGTSEVYGGIGYRYFLSGAITNIYWSDVNASDNATGCYNSGDTGCTKTTPSTSFYASTHNVYDSSAPYWDANWIWSGLTYPILSWASAPPDHLVTFDSQSATIEASPTSKTVFYPETTVVTLPTPPTKTGYTFGGWYTAVDGGGTSFIESTLVADNITVYAKWTVAPAQVCGNGILEGTEVCDYTLIDPNISECEVWADYSAVCGGAYSVGCVDDCAGPYIRFCKRDCTLSACVTSSCPFSP